jgi:outer membrane receptor protein involved in Fe transport
MRFTQVLCGTASAVVLAGMGAGAVQAQQAAPAQNEIPTVDSIVVTAQKREQNLQDVPIVVTAVSAKQLEGAGVKDIKDLQILTPGLNVASTSNETNTTVRIRGVGTVGDNPGLESSVSVVIDGVYRPRNGVAFNDLGEMERVEVLKGPQGTLFGKNTSAGVINVLTKAPEFEFGAEAEATFGNYGSKGGSVAVTGPIIADKLAGRLFAAKRERDGFYTIKTGAGPRTATDDANQDFYTIRGQLLATPTDELKFRFIGDYTKRDERCCVGVQIVTGATGPILDALSADSGVSIPAKPFDRISYANRPTDQQIEDKGVSLEGEWTTPWLGGATLTSITAAREWTTNNGQDVDFSTADVAYRNGDQWRTRFKQFSQELRFAGRAEKGEWLIGAFYADEDLDQLTPFRYGSAYETYLGLLLSGGASPTFVSALTGRAPGTSYTANSGSLDAYAQNSKSLSFFTNDTYHLTDRIDLTIGLRHTHELKTLATQYTNLPGNNGCAATLGRTGTIVGIVGAANAATVIGNLCLPWTDPGFNNYSSKQKRNEKEWTGTFKVSAKVTDDIMSYVSWAKGYKAGGFNLDRSRIGLGAPNPDTGFAPETVESIEVGFKTSWLNRRLSVNSAFFHQSYDGFQLNTFTGVSYIVTSIPKVESFGVDTDLLWFTPIRGLSLQGGVTYAETEYGPFIAPTGVSPRLSDARLSFAPLWSGSLAASYEHDLGSSLLFHANLSAKYSSSYNTGSDLAPQKVQPKMTVMNGRIGIGSQTGLWTVDAWAQNLTNKKYYQVGYDGPLQSGTYDAFLGAPRTYGVTLKARF